MLIVIIGISQYNKIYYSFYINGDSFKSSSIEDKSKLLNDRNFRENCSDNTFEKAVMLLYEDVISRGSVEDKIDLLDNSDFTHFSSDDLRKSLIESIVDTPDIPSITYNRFLFKVCRSIDFKIVADRIEEKKNILPSDVISKISSNLSYISKNSEDKKKWENIIERNSEDLKQVALEKANKYINDSNYENKVSFLRTLDYSKFLTIEMKEKLMDSILEITNSEEKLIYFLFEECNFENFELAGQVLEKKKFNFEANTLYKIKKEILNKKYNNSLAWIRIIENFTEEFEKKIAELAKPIIENKDFAEKINLYRRPDFIHFASDETKLQLIDSMTSLNNIHKNKLIHFLFNTCDKKEFDFITKRISETGCNWELSVFTEIKLNISRSYKEYNNEYLNSIVRNYKILRERKAELVFKKIKESSSLKEKIELTKSGDFSYASYDIRKQVAELLADTAIVSGSLDEKISVFETGNTKYTPQTTREKLLISIINDPKIEDNQLRDLLLVCKEKECSITFNKMVEKKTFLPQKYISRLIEIDTFRMVNKDDISKIFQENPIGSIMKLFICFMLTNSELFKKIKIIPSKILL